MIVVVSLDLINDEDLRDDVEKFLKNIKTEEATPKSNVKEDARDDKINVFLFFIYTCV